MDKYGPASVIVTTNTFNHIGDLHNFMAGVKRWLADDGIFVIEVPWAKDLLDRNEFDTIYHEHVSEFSLLSLVKLGAFFDLVVVDVDRLGVHGGSMRVYMKPAAAVTSMAPIVPEMLAEEREAGMLSEETYQEFSARIDKVGTDLEAMLADCSAKGLKIAGYGAPAKGNTLLNFFKIGPDTLDYLVDRNTLKQGFYSPGMKIPIRSPEALVDERPDVLLVLAWNFFDEIRLQQKRICRQGRRISRTVADAGSCLLIRQRVAQTRQPAPPIRIVREARCRGYSSPEALVLSARIWLTPASRRAIRSTLSSVPVPVG